MRVSAERRGGTSARAECREPHNLVLAWPHTHCTHRLLCTFTSAARSDRDAEDAPSRSCAAQTCSCQAVAASCLSQTALKTGAKVRSLRSGLGSARDAVSRQSTAPATSPAWTRPRTSSVTCGDGVKFTVRELGGAARNSVAPWSHHARRLARPCAVSRAPSLKAGRQAARAACGKCVPEMHQRRCLRLRQRRGEPVLHSHPVHSGSARRRGHLARKTFSCPCPSDSEKPVRG